MVQIEELRPGNWVYYEISGSKTPTAIVRIKDSGEITFEGIGQSGWRAVNFEPIALSGEILMAAGFEVSDETIFWVTSDYTDGSRKHFRISKGEVGWHYKFCPSDRSSEIHEGKISSLHELQNIFSDRMGYVLRIGFDYGKSSLGG